MYVQVFSSEVNDINYGDMRTFSYLYKDHGDYHVKEKRDPPSTDEDGVGDARIRCIWATFIDSG